MHELFVSLIGAFVIVGWIAPFAWVLRPGGTDHVVTSVVTAPLPPQNATAERPGDQSASADPSLSLASAKAARSLTRKGLLGMPVAIAVGFLAVRLLFSFSGWFQLAWVVGIVLASYTMWRVVILWPTEALEDRLQRLIAAHGMRSPGLPWAMIAIGVALLALWLVPPLLLF